MLAERDPSSDLAPQGHLLPQGEKGGKPEVGSELGFSILLTLGTGAAFLQEARQAGGAADHV